MAVNCWVVPAAIEGVAGLTAMLTRVAALTVRVVLPLTSPSVAPMLLVPTASPVARPPALMVATAGVAEAQPTEPVRSAVVASL